jgi:ATP synthase protein I
LANDPTDQSENADQERLDELGRKIEAARKSSPEQGPQRSSGSHNLAYRLPTEFVAAVFVGAAFGWGFDVITGLKPVGIIVFTILGIVAAFSLVFRLVRKPDADKNEGK